MTTKSAQFENGFREGYALGRADGIDWERGKPYEMGPYTFTPNAHDLDTVAMGIALVVIHAADIETIAATMETQQKLGIAEKVLGWLHLIVKNTEAYNETLSLRETDPHPWLNPDIVPGWEEAAAQQFEKPEFPNGEFGKPEEADGDIPY